MYYIINRNGAYFEIDPDVKLSDERLEGCRIFGDEASLLQHEGETSMGNLDQSVGGFLLIKSDDASKNLICYNDFGPTANLDPEELEGFISSVHPN